MGRNKLKRMSMLWQDSSTRSWGKWTSIHSPIIRDRRLRIKSHLRNCILNLNLPIRRSSRAPTLWGWKTKHLRMWTGSRSPCHRGTWCDIITKLGTRESRLKLSMWWNIEWDRIRWRTWGVLEVNFCFD